MEGWNVEHDLQFYLGVSVLKAERYIYGTLSDDFCFVVCAHIDK